MRIALNLARTRKGLTGENPSVGCVIVKNDRLIGLGQTGLNGRPHAEVEAIRIAEIRGNSLSGSTLYCTVEPCSFHGRSPSCANTIIEKNISHVVTAIRDPHPKVNGEGIRLLKEAGISVTEGIEEDAARISLAEWLKGY